MLVTPQNQLDVNVHNKVLFVVVSCRVCFFFIYLGTSYFGILFSVVWGTIIQMRIYGCTQQRLCGACV